MDDILSRAYFGHNGEYLGRAPKKEYGFEYIVYEKDGISYLRDPSTYARIEVRVKTTLKEFKHAVSQSNLPLEVKEKVEGMGKLERIVYVRLKD